MDRHRLVQRVKLLADLCELRRVDANNRAVFGLRDGKVLVVQLDEVHGELGGAHRFGVLEHKLEVSGIVVRRQGDAVGRVCELHHFGQEVDVDAQNHVCVSAVVLESLHGQVEGNQGDVGSVHGLQ